MLSGPVAAQIYYVDNSSAAASDNNSGTSQAAPWLTLKHTSDRRFLPGDTIAIKAGTKYSGGLAFYSSGSTSAPVTIKSYGSGAKPLITNNPAYGSYSNAVVLNNAAYVVIDGLALTSAAHAGVELWNSNNITVQNCEAYGVGVGVQISGNNNLITNNYFHDLIMVVNHEEEDNYGAEGIVVTGIYNELSYNRCDHCIAEDNYYGLNGKLFELYGTVDYTYIHDNIATNSGGFLEGGVGTALNVNISKNISYNNSGGFLVIHYQGSYAYANTSFLVTYNTVVETATLPDSDWALNYIDKPPTTTSILLENNIMVINNEAAIYSYDVPRKNNLYYLMQGSSHIMINGKNTFRSGEFMANPLFVNLAGGDFHLTAQSPARGKGLPIPMYWNPAQPKPRSVTTKPDLGALPYGSP